MKHETVSILQTPFTDSQIKKRKGLWGKILDYIEGHSVIARLNEAFESEWSFNVVEHHILDEEVIVLGRLTAGNIVKEQFGSNKITKDSETGRVLCLGDDLKSAATDSLKKCASLLGVGLHLYGEVAPQQKENSHVGENNNKPSNNNGSNGKLSNGNGSNGSGENLITPKQKKYVLTLGRRTNLDTSQVNKLCIENYSAPLENLSKSDASDLIALLTA